MKHKVLYLTGIPGVGKSTVSNLLSDRVPNLKIFAYSSELQKMMQSKGATVSHSDLRSRSAQIVSPELISELDQELISFVQRERQANHVLIDSHAVTLESYGMRITPFSLQKVVSLGIDLIVCLVADPAAILARTVNAPDGRSLPTEDQVRRMASLQATVAITYGVLAGIAVYFIDTEAPPESIVAEIAKRLSR